jgi:hypothetical protein
VLEKRETPVLSLGDAMAALYHHQTMPNKKYADGLFLVDMCIKEKDPIKATELFDSVIQYAKNVFPKPDPLNEKENKRIIREIIDGGLYKEELRAIPPKVNDEIYLVILVRLVLRNTREINPLHSQEFKWFHENYHTILW